METRFMIDFGPELWLLIKAALLIAGALLLERYGRRRSER